MKTPSLESFRAWLAKQPDEREFHYMNNYTCILASYAREELGHEDVCCYGYTIAIEGREVKIADAGLKDINDITAGFAGRFTISDVRQALAKLDAKANASVPQAAPNGRWS